MLAEKGARGRPLLRGPVREIENTPLDDRSCTRPSREREIRETGGSGYQQCEIGKPRSSFKQETQSKTNLKRERQPEEDEPYSLTGLLRAVPILLPL